MLRLLALAILLGGVAVVALLVPIRGRTVADRWQAAPDASAFLSSAWSELRGEEPRRRSADRERAAPRPPRAEPRKRAPEPARPSEQHSEADRRELDRLLSRHAR
jgi:hypothetical protein